MVCQDECTERWQARPARIVALLVLTTWVLWGSDTGAQVAVPKDAASRKEAHALVEFGAGATLDDYLRAAALRNPDLQVAFYEWQAAAERVPQVRSLPDPHLSYSYFIESVETFAGPQRNRLGASQRFPWPGKRGLAAAGATHEAEATRQRYEARKLELGFRVVDAYAEYYYLGRAIEVTREDVELLTSWEELTRARYRVGEATYPDVVNAQVALGKLDDRLRTLDERRAPTMARLDALLDRTERTPLPWPRRLPFEQVAPREEDLQRALEAKNPHLLAEAAQVTAAERDVALAKKSYFPDVTLGIEWIDTDERAGPSRSKTGDDAVIGTLSMNLPIWWPKYGAEVREAEARRMAASRARRGRVLDLAARLQRVQYQRRDAERKIELYGGALIPKGREALDANFAAYESDRADFRDLLDAQRLLLEFQLEYERALADHAVRLAEIEMLVGEPLPRVSAAEAASEDRS